MTTDVDYTRVMFGPNAVHVPAWLYVQEAGSGLVSFAGGSRVPDLAHPLRYGSDHTHHLIVGELIVRPHSVIGTDALRGTGIAGLITGDYHEEAITTGQLLVGRVPPR